jgi:hypothetical protein
MRKIVKEGLDYLDFDGQIEPNISVDEYVAKTGDDDDIVTVAFVVRGRQAGADLANWFERGYDWVLDAKVSDGELDTNKYVVFVEMDRRSTTPKRIITLLSDLETLTGMALDDWSVTVEDEDYDADEDILKQVIKCSPHEYREAKEGELNEMRNIAGLSVLPSKKMDDELRNFIINSGI